MTMVKSVKTAAGNVFYGIFEAVSAGITVTDSKGILEWVNGAYCEMLGFSGDELRGKVMTTAIKPDMQRMIWEYYSNVLEMGAGEPLELELIHKTGRIVYVVVSFGVIELEDSGRYIVSSFTDISERKKWEENLRLMNIILKTNLESTPYGTLIINRKGEIVLINKNLSVMFGIPVELSEQNNYFKIYDYIRTISDEKSELVNLKHYVLSMREDIIQNELVLKDGRVFSRFVSPMIDEFGEYHGAVIFLNDITKQREQETILKKAKETAVEAARLKSQFLANISHEIRTPLNSIIGFSQLLAGYLTEEKQKYYLSTILSSGKNLLNLINDILDLSKIESGRLELQYSSTNIYFLINEIHNTFSIESNAKNIEFKLEIDPFVPPGLLLDEIRVRQILINLIGNAIKFTDTGYIKLLIIAKFNNREKSNLDLTLMVEDTGIGIDETQQTVIFESFRQQSGQSTRKYGGTGLGLSITKKLVEAMRGSISLKSKPGVGSVFSVVLPDINTSKPMLDIDKYMKNSDYVIFENSTIVLAGTEQIHKEIIQGLLINSGLKIIEVHSGSNAVELSILYKPDAVLIDLKIKDIDPHRLVSIFRNTPELANTTLIALISRTEIKNEKIQLFDFDGFVYLPIHKADLIDELTKHLPHYYTSQEKTILTEANTIENYLCAELLKNFALQLESNDIEKNSADVRNIQEMLGNWNEVNGSSILDEIKAFASKNIELGSDLSCKPLIIYGNLLFKQVNGFEFDTFPKTLSEYPILIEEILNLYKKN